MLEEFINVPCLAARKGILSSLRSGLTPIGCGLKIANRIDEPIIRGAEFESRLYLLASTLNR